MYTGKKVLVFGGFGFIGLNLLQKLIDAGAIVTVMDTQKEAPLEDLISKINYQQGDIRDSELVATLVKNQDVLFNLAGKSGPANSMADPKTDLDINCGGVLTILEAVRQSNPELKIIFPGSRLEFGKVKKVPVNEDDPMRPTSLYGIHKLAAEKYHLAYFDNFGLRSTVFRISNPYGPHLVGGSPGYNIINYFFDQAMKGEVIKIFGDGSQKRDYLFVGDLVKLFLQAGLDTKSDGQVFNIGYGQAISLLEMAEIIIKTVGKGSIEKVPWTAELQKIETGDYVSDISKVKEYLSWEPEVNPQMGVEMMIKSQNEQYWVTRK